MTKKEIAKRRYLKQNRTKFMPPQIQFRTKIKFRPLADYSWLIRFRSLFSV